MIIPPQPMSGTKLRVLAKWILAGAVISLVLILPMLPALLGNQAALISAGLPPVSLILAVFVAIYGNIFFTLLIKGTRLTVPLRPHRFEVPLPDSFSIDRLGQAKDFTWRLPAPETFTINGNWYRAERVDLRYSIAVGAEEDTRLRLSFDQNGFVTAVDVEHRGLYASFPTPAGADRQAILPKGAYQVYRRMMRDLTGLEAHVGLERVAVKAKLDADLTLKEQLAAANQERLRQELDSAADRPDQGLRST